MILVLSVALVLAAPNPVRAAEQKTVLVAVAANFGEVAAALEPAFEDLHPGVDVRLSVGSTGKLFAQIRAGAPFDLFMAADQARPERLVETGEGVAGSQVTYAVGRLALWTAQPGLELGPDSLSSDDMGFLALANPRLAPYGRAGQQVLVALGAKAALAGRLAMGQNVGQAFSMVATGNAQAGLVALSSVLSPRNQIDGSYWLVPAELHEPIRQDAVLLDADSAAARDFFDFLTSARAQQIITRFGYEVP